MEVAGIRADLDAPVSVLGVVPVGDAREAHERGAAVLCGGKPVSAVAAFTEADLTRVWAKYRNRLWGTDFMGPDEFRMAVRELLGR